MTRVSFIAAIAAAAGVATAGDLYLQDFEDGTGYSTSITEYTDGGSDYFTRTDGTNFNPGNVYNGADGFYFAGQDIDDGNTIGLPVYLTTDSFSIVGATNLMFTIDLAEADDGTSQDWDLPDFVDIEYRVDNGDWMNIFTVEGDGSTFNSEPQVNGTAVTDTFSEFSAALYGVSGSSMEIRITWSLDSGDEDLAIDNIRLTGDLAVVPLPPAAFAGLGMLGLMAGCKLRRK